MSARCHPHIHDLPAPSFPTCTYRSDATDLSINTDQTEPRSRCGAWVLPSSVRVSHETTRDRKFEAKEHRTSQKERQQSLSSESIGRQACKTISTSIERPSCHCDSKAAGIDRSHVDATRRHPSSQQLALATSNRQLHDCHLISFPSQIA